MKTFNLKDHEDHQLVWVVMNRFGGKLRFGSHVLNGKCCLHEAESATMAIRMSPTGNIYIDEDILKEVWTDYPGIRPDFRSLNDALWLSNMARTENCLRVLLAWWDWPEWTLETKEQKAKDLLIFASNIAVPSSGITRLEDEHKKAFKEAECVTDAYQAVSSALSAPYTWETISILNYLLYSCEVLLSSNPKTHESLLGSVNQAAICTIACFRPLVDLCDILVGIAEK